jgi:hypothetical protein
MMVVEGGGWKVERGTSFISFGGIIIVTTFQMASG